jgi:hypothetical protein
MVQIFILTPQIACNAFMFLKTAGRTGKICISKPLEEL